MDKVVGCKGLQFEENAVIAWHCPQNHRVSEICLAHDYEKSATGNFKILYCEQCDLGYTNPVPTQETAYLLYSEKNSTDFDVVTDSMIDRLKNYFARKTLKKISKQRKITSVLDYSTGNGRFAVQASQLFQDAVIVATDYQDEPPCILMNYAGVQYVNVKNLSQQKFDLIILRHVLEHSYEPVQLLQELAAKLTSNGVIYIEVPNLNSACARLFKKYWTGYYVPYHVLHFTQRSLADVLHAAGLCGEVKKSEMPKMGNTLSAMTGVRGSFALQILGILLHPVQLMLEFFYRGSTCLYVCALKKK